MKFNTTIIFATILTAFLSILACTHESGELSELNTDHKDLIIRNNSLSFDKKMWANASQEVRGKMVKSLFDQNQFIGKKNTIVSDLLGFRTCYIDNEDQPCYELIYDGNRYYLVFYVDHSDDRGIICRIELFSRD